MTAKPVPNDIDLIVVLPAGHDFTAAVPAALYDLLSKRRLRQAGYPFDVLVVAAASPAYDQALALFRQVRGRPELSKGLLRWKP